jgi:uncharacterized protein (TIGR00290 family)
MLRMGVIGESRMPVAAVSWSGGKDCCLALWKALSQGLSVKRLVNTYRQESGRVAFHGTGRDLLRSQAKAMGMELIQTEVGDHDYENRLVAAFRELNGKVDGIIFGDIDSPENRKWSENAARKAGLEAYFPLWEIDQRSLLTEFIDCGFRAIVVCIDTRYFEKEALGRQIDGDWLHDLDEMQKRKNRAVSTYCGENGEYHSFVFGGPFFKSDIMIRLGTTVRKDSHWLIDVQDSSGSHEANFSTTSNI